MTFKLKLTVLFLTIYFSKLFGSDVMDFLSKDNPNELKFMIVNKTDQELKKIYIELYMNLDTEEVKDSRELILKKTYDSVASYKLLYDKFDIFIERYRLYRLNIKIDGQLIGTIDVPDLLNRLHKEAIGMRIAQFGINKSASGYSLDVYPNAESIKTGTGANTDVPGVIS